VPDYVDHTCTLFMAPVVRRLLMLPLACSLVLAYSSAQACEKHWPNPQGLANNGAALSPH
jgi:hypothetical protein